MEREMNPEIKQKWVDALRSGEYKQGRGSLRQKHEGGDATYCCMGVLACLLGEPEEAMGSSFIYSKSDFASGKYQVRKCHEDDHVPNARDRWTLSYFNDKEDRSFLEIADWIEANL
jgi:hypothetical protein